MESRPFTVLCGLVAANPNIDDKELWSQLCKNYRLKAKGKHLSFLACFGQLRKDPNNLIYQMIAKYYEGQLVEVKGEENEQPAEQTTTVSQVNQAYQELKEEKYSGHYDGFLFYANDLLVAKPLNLKHPFMEGLTMFLALFPKYKRYLDKSIRNILDDSQYLVLDPRLLDITAMQYHSLERTWQLDKLYKYLPPKVQEKIYLHQLKFFNATARKSLAEIYPYLSDSKRKQVIKQYLQLLTTSGNRSFPYFLDSYFFTVIAKDLSLEEKLACLDFMTQLKNGIATAHVHQFLMALIEASSFEDKSKILLELFARLPATYCSKVRIGFMEIIVEGFSAELSSLQISVLAETLLEMLKVPNDSDLSIMRVLSKIYSRIEPFFQTYLESYAFRQSHEVEDNEEIKLESVVINPLRKQAVGMLSCTLLREASQSFTPLQSRVLVKQAHFVTYPFNQLLIKDTEEKLESKSDLKQHFFDYMQETLQEDIPSLASLEGIFLSIKETYLCFNSVQRGLILDELLAILQTHHPELSGAILDVLFQLKPHLEERQKTPVAQTILALSLSEQEGIKALVLEALPVYFEDLSSESRLRALPYFHAQLEAELRKERLEQPLNFTMLKLLKEINPSCPSLQDYFQKALLDFKGLAYFQTFSFLLQNEGKGQTLVLAQAFNQLNRQKQLSLAQVINLIEDKSRPLSAEQREKLEADLKAILKEAITELIATEGRLAFQSELFRVEGASELSQKMILGILIPLLFETLKKHATWPMKLAIVKILQDSLNELKPLDQDYFYSGILLNLVARELKSPHFNELVIVLNLVYSERAERMKALHHLMEATPLPTVLADLVVQYSHVDSLVEVNSLGREMCPPSFGL